MARGLGQVGQALAKGHTHTKTLLFPYARLKHSARNSGRSSLSYPPTRGRAGASLLWGFSPLELGRSGNSHCEWRADADSWTLGDLDAAARRWRRGQVWRRPRRPRNRALAVGRLRARLGIVEV